MTAKSLHIYQKHWKFSLVMKTRPVCFLQHPKIEFHFPMYRYIFSGFSLSMFCNTVPGSLFFRSKFIKTDFTTRHIAVKKVVDFDSKSFLWKCGNIFFTEARVCPSGSEERSWYKISTMLKFHNFLDRSLSYIGFLLTFPWLSLFISLW